MTNVVITISEEKKLRRCDVFHRIAPDVRITDLVAESMTHKRDNASKLIGINEFALNYIRKLLIISKHYMQAEDRSKLQQCLETLNAEKSLVHVRPIANQIISKYWLAQKPRKEKRDVAVKRFDCALIALNEICETAAEFDIPFGYTVEQIRAAILKVNAAKKALAMLSSKLKGEVQ